jgi:FdrA protein
MTLFALEALAADPATQAIVVISKPPHPSVLARLEAKLATITKPTVVCCVGEKPRAGERTVWVDTLDQAGDAAVALLSGRRWQPRRFGDAARVTRRMAESDATAGAGKTILGLYTGGTLAYETGHLLAAALGADHPHRVLDLGDDEYTVGRPHPMIDPSVRNDMIVRAGSDRGIGVVLLDLVLGKGAHANPAESLVVAVGDAKRAAATEGRSLAFVASIVGTSRDPQGLAAQQEALEQAGVSVLATNADAARCAAMLVAPQLAARWMTQEA